MDAPLDKQRKLEEGRWSKEEHEKFIEAIHIYNKNWKKVEEHVQTRNGAQIRSHAQKFFNRIQKENKKKTGKDSIDCLKDEEENLSTSCTKNTDLSGEKSNKKLDSDTKLCDQEVKKFKTDTRDDNQILQNISNITNCGKQNNINNNQQYIQFNKQYQPTTLEQFFCNQEMQKNMQNLMIQAMIMKQIGQKQQQASDIFQPTNTFPNFYINQQQIKQNEYFPNQQSNNYKTDTQQKRIGSFTVAKAQDQQKQLEKALNFKRKFSATSSDDLNLTGDEYLQNNIKKQIKSN